MLIIDDSVLIVAEKIVTERDEQTGKIVATEDSGYVWLIEHCCGAVTELLSDYCVGCGSRL